MFQERYNRIVLPFFFLSELFLLAAIFLFTKGIYLSNVGIDLLLISIIWAVPSLFFRSYRAPRTDSICYSNNERGFDNSDVGLTDTSESFGLPQPQTSCSH